MSVSFTLLFFILHFCALNCLFLATTQVQTGKEFRERLQSYQQNMPGCDLFFICSEQQHDGEPYEKRMQHIENSPTYETNMIKQWFSAMESQFNQELNNELPDQSLWEQVMGFDNACRCIYARMWQDIQKHLPRVKNSLNLKQSELRGRLRNLKAMKEAMSPDNMDKILTDFITALSVKMKDYTHRFGDNSEARTTLFEEVEEALTPGRNPLLDVEICSCSTNETRWMEQVKIFANDLNSDDSDDFIRANTQTFGPRQFPRGIAFFQLAVAQGVANTSCTNNEVHDLIGYNSGDIVAPQWESACLGIVEKIRRMVIHPAINFSIKHMAYNMFKYLNVAKEHVIREDLSKTFGNLSDAFYEHILSAYIEFLVMLTEKTAAPVHMDIASLCGVILPQIGRKFGQLRPKGEGEAGYFNFDNDVNNFLHDVQQADGLQDDTMLKRVAEHVRHVLWNRAKELNSEQSTFMSSSRATVVKNEEIKGIIETSYTYIHGLLEMVFILFEASFNSNFLRTYRNTLLTWMRDALRTFPKKGAFKFNAKQTEASAQKIKGQLEDLTNLFNKLQLIDDGAVLMDDDQSQPKHSQSGPPR